MNDIYPVLLCGGSGTRLWPLSRKSYPKQFASLIGDKTLFQASALRVFGQNDHGLEWRKPIVVTNSDFRFIVTEQLSEVGVDPGTILIEPEGKNTAPAILAAALHVAQTDPDAVLLVAPSDHLIPDVSAFQQAISMGLTAVKNGQMVTFGITPTHAETAYGYLELATPSVNGNPCALARFVEKPSADIAAEMLAAGNYLWNAGIFLVAAKDVITACKTHAEALLTPVKRAVEEAIVDLGFLRLAPDEWTKVEDISIDYAVMEHATNLSVVPFGEAWSDLGGWDAVWREHTPDTNGVVSGANTTAIECQNTLLRSETAGLEVVGLGLENVMAIAMNDAVLVADMSRAQDVKKAVDALKTKKASQAVSFAKDHRPWGWFESLAISDRFQVKRIHVHPNAALSLQSHHHRSEHWIVVQGTARVTIDDDVKLVAENESVYIPLGAKHRLENPGKVSMVLIEVQTGAYLGEDDIIRYEDLYARD